MKRKCKHCKESFPIKRVNQYYCSQSCRQQAYLIRNGFSKEKNENLNSGSENLLKNVAGAINPELLQGIMSVLGGNASMTDFFDKKPEKPNDNKENNSAKKEESVNDAKPKNKGIMQEFLRKRMLSKRIPDETSRFMEAKHETVVQNTVIMEKKSAFMDNSCGSHGEVMEDSCCNHGSFMRESCDEHVSSMEKACDKHDVSMGKSCKIPIVSPTNTSKPAGNDTFSDMVAQKYTLPIGPKGFVKSLFPHWNEKEWKISLLVNDRLLTALDCLLKGSMKKRIKTSILNDCMKDLHEITDGVSGIMLPLDYPFTKFIQYVKPKLAIVVHNAGKKEEIKFRLSEELEQQITIVMIQLRK